MFLSDSSTPLSMKRKTTRSDFGIAEELKEMLYQLGQKRAAEWFKLPVDPKDAHDYYDRIKNPMDLSTVEKKLKDNTYLRAIDLLSDLQLIVDNCMTYNVIQNRVRKDGESFRQSIKTVWDNFQKEIAKKGISIATPIEITPQVLENFDLMDQKRRKRQPISTMGLIEPIERRSRLSDGQFDLYPHSYDSLQGISAEEKQQKQDLMNTHFEVRVDDYYLLSEEDKQNRMKIVIDQQKMQAQFSRLSRRKLEKYRKLLGRKLKWLQIKLLQKAKVHTKLSRFKSPQLLFNLTQDNDMVNGLIIKRIQMFLKQIVSWVHTFKQLFSHRIKERFINVCRDIRCILNQLKRYRRIAPKSTKITLQNPFIGQQSIADKAQSNQPKPLPPPPPSLGQDPSLEAGQPSAISETPIQRIQSQPILPMGVEPDKLQASQPKHRRYSIESEGAAEVERHPPPSINIAQAQQTENKSLAGMQLFRLESQIESQSRLGGDNISMMYSEREVGLEADAKSNQSEQAKGYQQSNKQFRRLLNRQFQTYVRQDLVIALVEDQRGNLSIRETSLDYEKNNRLRYTDKNRSKKLSSREFSQPETPSKEHGDELREEELNRERLLDRQFTAQYNSKRNNIEIVKKYKSRLAVNWDAILEKKTQPDTPESFMILL